MNSAKDYIAFACVILFLVGIIILFSYLLSRSNKRKRAHIAKLKANYDQALLAKDKPEALRAGRLYYSAIRGGRFTDGDEIRISNDLSTI